MPCSLSEKIVLIEGILRNDKIGKFPRLLLSVGKTDLLEEENIAILNSRMPRMPLAESDWIHQSIDCIGSIQGKTILSSFGSIQWDIITWQAAQHGLNLIIVCAEPLLYHAIDYAREIIHDFNLDHEKVCFLFFSHEKAKLRQHLQFRDKLITALADEIRPISIRKTGNLNKLLSHSTLKDTVKHNWQIDYLPIRHKPKKPEITQNLKDNFNLSEFLIHWTRSTHEAWPGESRADFINDLTSLAYGYPRDGFATLKRIITEKRIRACGSMIRGNYPVVSFTGRSPGDLDKLILWRPALVRWTWEGYGIAIKNSALDELGIKKVIYAENDLFESLQHDQKHLFQVKQGDISWQHEAEWRILGDVNLSKIATEDIVILVSHTEEREILKDLANNKIISLSHQ